MDRKSMLLTAVLTALLAVVLFGDLVLAAGTPAVFWWVVGSGGGRSEAGAFVLNATVGQAVAGTGANGPWRLCAGFWCTLETHHIYLPLVVRGG